MARITRPPQFSFDDSLVPLNRRQDPLTQTQRGNYEWTWAQAALWHTVPAPGEGPPIFQKYTPSVTANDVISFLMFGADVPHLAFYFAEPDGQLTYNAALQTYYTQTNTVFTALNAYFAGLTPPGPVIVLPSVPTAPAVCYTRQGVARRPGTLPPSWYTIGPVTDDGQGSLVSIAAGSYTLQGFPLVIDDLLCDPPEPPTSIPFDGITLTVGYESQLNHGSALSEPTGPENNGQPAYTPIILRVDDYTAAIYNNGNVIVDGSRLLIVVGVFQLEGLT